MTAQPQPLTDAEVARQDEEVARAWAAEERAAWERNETRPCCGRPLSACCCPDYPWEEDT